MSNFHYGGSAYREQQSNNPEAQPPQRQYKPNNFQQRPRDGSPQGPRSSQSPRTRKNPVNNAPREYKRSRSRDFDRRDRPSNFVKRSSSRESRVQLDFKVLIKQRYIDKGYCSFSSLDEIVKRSGVEDIILDDEVKSPEIAGKILIIKSKSIDKKAEAFIMLMRMLEDTEALIFIPHTLVSMIIGSRGRTINQIKKDSGCEIMVNQTLPGLPYCSIELRTSSPRVQSSTCKQIYELLERQASSEDLKEQKVKQVTKSSIRTKAKFVISEDSQGYLIGKHGSFTKQLEDIGIYMHCGKDQQNRALRPREAVCSLDGNLEDIEEATFMLVKRLEAYYEASKKDYEQVPLALLIPHNLVTKIIGQGGSQIKRLCEKTHSQIRVGCSKHDKEMEEVVVTIDGKLGPKQRGACAVLQQVEIFKSSTPVSLNTSLNKNSQF